MSLNRADMSSLGQSAGDCRNWGLSAFSFCLGKNKGKLRSGSLLPISSRQLQFDTLGRGRILQSSRVQQRKPRVVCQELDRNSRLSPSAAGWARWLLRQPLPSAQQLALAHATEGRASLPAAVPVTTRLWPRLLTQS